MEQNDFNKSVVGAISESLGEGYRIELKKVSKNNGIVLDGLIVHKKGDPVAPTIYLNGFYEDLCNGSRLDEIIGQIEDTYKSHITPRINAEFFRNYENVRTRILYKLVNAEKNKEMLGQVPHIIWNDLAIVFYYSFPKGEIDNATILIHNSNIEMWDVTVDELRKCGEKNMPVLAPDEIVPMSELLSEMIGADNNDIADDDRHIPMYVLSNSARLYGASAMLYSHRLVSLAENIKRNLYILPSSVHEVILLPDEGEGDPEYLMSTIREVNETQVEPEEVLSDKLYYFDRDTQHITVVSA